jgi:hypothetical protein
MTFALALASTAAPPLNTAFYSVAATVIPVLYLAIAVQGDTYRAVMSYAIDRDNRFWHWWRSPKSHRGAAKAIADLLLAGAMAMTIFFAVVGLGVGGEITALFALLLRVRSLAPAAFVLASATGLTLIAGRTSHRLAVPVGIQRHHPGHPASSQPRNTGSRAQHGHLPEPS